MQNNEHLIENAETENKKNTRKKTIEKMVYTPSEVRAMLGLSKSSTYSFLNEVYEKQSPFRVLKIRTLIRIPKEGFDEWLKIVK